MHIISRSYLSGMLLISVLATGAFQQVQAVTVRVGTGSTTGVYFPVGSSTCRALKKERKRHKVRCTVRATAGSQANLEGLAANKLQFAVMQNDAQYAAYKSGDPAYQKLSTVFTLHLEIFTVVSRSGAGIREFKQLQGKRVNLGEPGSGQRRMMESLMQSMGWTSGIFSQAAEISPAQQTIKLCNNDIDAFIYVVGHPNLSIQSAAKTCSIQLSNVRGGGVEQFIASSPLYERTVIPRGTYPAQNNDVSTFGVRASLVTRADVPTAQVYELVKAVFENFLEFSQSHPALQTLKPQNMLKGNVTPMHPGALQYYREKGWM